MPLITSDRDIDELLRSSRTIALVGCSDRPDRDSYRVARYLQQQGYTANYFTGTSGHFDRIDAFMERQGVDRFVDAAGFGPGYAREPASPGGESWGYPDGVVFLILLHAQTPSYKCTTTPGTTPVEKQRKKRKRQLNRPCISE